MSLISPTFANELSEKEMRDAYLSAQTRTYLSSQIRTIRSQRGWSQEEFAEKLDTSQSAVSRMEDRQYGKQSLQTLVETANTFDCGLLVQFVPYDKFIRETNDLSREALQVPQFNSAALLPLAEDLPSVAVSQPERTIIEHFPTYAFVEPMLLTNVPLTGTKLLNFGSQLPTAQQKVDVLQKWMAAIIGQQDIQTSRSSTPGTEARIRELEAQNARLKEENEKLSQTRTTVFVLNQRPSQFPGLS